MLLYPIDFAFSTYSVGVEHFFASYVTSIELRGSLTSGTFLADEVEGWAAHLRVNSYFSPVLPEPGNSTNFTSYLAPFVEFRDRTTVETGAVSALDIRTEAQSLSTGALYGVLLYHTRNLTLDGFAGLGVRFTRSQTYGSRTPEMIEGVFNSTYSGPFIRGGISLGFGL